MITLDNGRLYFNESHLFEPKITDMDGILKRYENYSVNIFLHIVSDPSCGYEKGVGSSRIPNSISGLSAKERFISLLASKKLLAGAKGYYANKLNSTDSFPDEIKSVSIAYCNFDDVPTHFDARNSQFGLVFFHDFLQSRGFMPVRYINEEDPETIRKLVFNDAFALEAYGRRYDMRWEKEWRINNDVEFLDEDIAFIVVPDNEYDYFLECVELGDYVTLPASVFLDAYKYYLMAHKMEHHAWNQISLWGEWKVDFDMFPEMNSEERETFLNKNSLHLDTLVKVEIQDVYEKRYISRFMNFANTLDEKFLAQTSFKDLQAVIDNTDEPYQTHRDIMFHCYESRFEIQRDRINI